MHKDDSHPAVQSKAIHTPRASIRPAGPQSGPGDAPVLDALAGNDPDRALIAAIAAGNEAAFNQIYARYYFRVARFTWRITRCSELTEEITNDTLLTIWRRARSFRGNSRVSTWIMGIAYHIGNNTLRRSSRRQAHEEPMREFIEAAHEPWSDGDDREWVAAALGQLTEEQRTALELFYCFGNSCEEIAEIVDCPANTVKTRMYYGRRNLRRVLPRLAGLTN
jgi:RNA polymerase sigma-70 factor, ECF subfamily